MGVAIVSIPQASLIEVHLQSQQSDRVSQEMSTFATPQTSASGAAVAADGLRDETSLMKYAFIDGHRLLHSATTMII